MSESMEINQKPISDEDEINAFNADSLQLKKRKVEISF